MNTHLHRARRALGWALGIMALSPFGLWGVEFPGPRNTLSDVTGRVTYSGRPLNDMTLCLDLGGVHSAFSTLDSDGSFRLVNMNEGRVGAYPGRYTAHLYTHKQGPSVPAKYRDPKTSGVEIEISADWSHLKIDLN
jgi:hypothetical protein